MIILNSANRPYIIESLTSPIPLRYHWTFSAHLMDFLHTEITYLEETMGPTVTLLIDGSTVRVPGSWNVLVVDMETYVVDVIPVTACAAFEHMAFIFSPTDGKLITAPIQAVNWEPKGVCIYPAVEKATAMVYAIAPGISHGKSTPRGVVVCPTDLHRWISGKTVGDILG